MSMQLTCILHNCTKLNQVAQTPLASWFPTSHYVPNFFSSSLGCKAFQGLPRVGHEHGLVELLVCQALVIFELLLLILIFPAPLGVCGSVFPRIFGDVLVPIASSEEKYFKNEVIKKLLKKFLTSEPEGRKTSTRSREEVGTSWSRFRAKDFLCAIIIIILSTSVVRCPVAA